MKVKEFATVVNGATPSSKCPEYYDGDIAWFTPKDLSDQGTKYVSVPERYITQEGYDSCSTSMLPAGSVLMSSRAPIGLLAISTVPCCTNQGFKSFNVDTKKCDSEYLYYYLKHHIKEIEALGSGTTFKEVSKESVENYDVFLPDVDIQKSLVKVLSEIDSKISNNNAICSDLEAMAKLLYDYWFVQFDFPDENGKPYKSSGGKMVWNEELKREIPAGWEVKKIGMVANLYQPKTISEKELIPYGKYLVYGANGIVGRYDKYNHEKNEVAICCRGASCGQYVMTQPYAWITGNAMVVTPKSYEISREFLYYGLSLPTISKFITGSAQPQITRTNLEQMKIIVPTKELLKEFENIASKIRQQLQNLFDENQELTSMRDFLLPMLMNGQVKIGGADL